MSFISYAQNFEDVMLWRALKHVEHGFYIDVGANDPSVDSVTKAFYDRGWTGMNIEPLNQHYEDLITHRPNDINLRIAAGSENGEIEIWECDVRGWATADPRAISAHSKTGHTGQYLTVPQRRLTEICEKHVTGEIHFLKIDVEGFEKTVIDGMDFSKYRPWILVIEATKPNSTEEVHDEWESDILTAKYTMCYTDGINRFYLANEHKDLHERFRHPPNVLDEYLSASQVNSEHKAQQAQTMAQQAEAKAKLAGVRATRAEAQAQQAEAHARQAEAQARQAEAQAQQAEAHARQAEAQAQQAEAHAWQAEAQAQQAEAHARQAEAHMNDLLSSTSWRITAPVRRVAGLVYRLKPQVLKSKLKTLLKDVALYIGQRPKLKRMTLVALGRFPSLKSRLLRLVQGSVAADSAAALYESTELPHLSLRARQIYADLKTAIENNK
jgi:FkbM family methyltransferase